MPYFGDPLHFSSKTFFPNSVNVHVSLSHNSKWVIALYFFDITYYYHHSFLVTWGQPTLNLALIFLRLIEFIPLGLSFAAAHFTGLCFLFCYVYYQQLFSCFLVVSCHVIFGSNHLKLGIFKKSLFDQYWKGNENITEKFRIFFEAVQFHGLFQRSIQNLS